MPKLQLRPEFQTQHMRTTAIELSNRQNTGWTQRKDATELLDITYPMVAKTGNIYAGLYYPIAVAGITFIIGSLLLKETSSVLIWKEMETGRGDKLKSDIDGPV